MTDHVGGDDGALEVVLGRLSDLLGQHVGLSVDEDVCAKLLDSLSVGVLGDGDDLVTATVGELNDAESDDGVGSEDEDGLVRLGVVRPRLEVEALLKSTRSFEEVRLESRKQSGGPLRHTW